MEGMRLSLLVLLATLIVGCKQPVPYQSKAQSVSDELMSRTSMPDPSKAPPQFPITSDPGPSSMDRGKVAAESAKISELRIEDLIPGTGPEAVDGKYLTVHYRGTLPDGFVFDTSVKQGGRPFIFQLGAGNVIRGWDVGMKGMRVGGLRRLTIPSNMAYGEAGGGPTVPPNAALIFEVYLLFVGDRP